MPKKYKIIQDYGRCIGCGGCVSSCPDNWVMEDGKAKPKKTEITEEEYECNKQAANACPIRIIKIQEIKE